MSSDILPQYSLFPALSLRSFQFPFKASSFSLDFLDRMIDSESDEDNKESEEVKEVMKEIKQNYAELMKFTSTKHKIVNQFIASHWAKDVLSSKDLEGMRKAEKEGEEKMRKLKLFVFKDGQKFSLEDYRKLRDEIKNVTSYLETLDIQYKNILYFSLSESLLSSMNPTSGSLSSHNLFLHFSSTTTQIIPSTLSEIQQESSTLLSSSIDLSNFIKECTGNKEKEQKLKI